LDYAAYPEYEGVKMDEILLGMIGLVIGLIGAGAGVAAMIWGFGWFEYLGGKKQLPVPAIRKSDLVKKLLALNSDDIPYTIKPGVESDIFVEWNLVNARWRKLLGDEGIRKIYRAFIMIDEERHTARYLEETGSVEWSIGLDGRKSPGVHFEKTFFQGRVLFQKEMAVQYYIKPDGSLGTAYKYVFDVSIVKQGIRQICESNGWEFVEVLNPKHAKRGR
jgi:hypothetical protein